MVIEQDAFCPSLVLVQPRKTHPSLTERLLMGPKESNQTNQTRYFFIFSLSISGKKVWAIIPPVEARSRNSGTPSTQSSEYSHLEEEIFEKEGEYEEIIAVDYKDM